MTDKETTLIYVPEPKQKPGESWQQRIYAATEARGYAAGWTPQQFAARQVIKAVEELAELVECIDVPDVRFDDLIIDIKRAAQSARWLFDDESVWDYTVKPGADTEAADVAVTLANFAVAWGFDLLKTAEDKATADIERGKRAE